MIIPEFSDFCSTVQEIFQECQVWVSFKMIQTTVTRNCNLFTNTIKNRNVNILFLTFWLNLSSMPKVSIGLKQAETRQKIFKKWWYHTVHVTNKQGHLRPWTKRFAGSDRNEGFIILCYEWTTGTGGAVCKGATPSVEQPEVVDSSPGCDPCSIRKYCKYLLKSLMMSTLHSASVLDKPRCLIR
jgi:hypothetical protein